MNNNINNNVGVNPGMTNIPGSNLNSGLTNNNLNANQGNVVPNNVSYNYNGISPSVTTIPNGVSVTNSVSNNQNSINNQDGIAANTYVLVGGIVGVVLLGSIVLLVLLVTGIIGNRNRLTCTKVVNENGYVYTEEKLYKFDKGYYVSVDKTFTYNYSNLTDERYETDFAAVLEANTTVSTYGFGTQIERNGNVVTITSYEPKYFNQTMDDVKTENSKEGFSCK